MEWDGKLNEIFAEMDRLFIPQNRADIPKMFELVIAALKELKSQVNNDPAT